MKILRNSIALVDLGTRDGHLQSGIRPCLIVSCNKANKYSPVYTIIPGTTSKNKKRLPVHFKVRKNDVRGYLGKTTTFLTEQMCTINDEQVIRKLGELESVDRIKAANRAIIMQLELEMEHDIRRNEKCRYHEN